MRAIDLYAQNEKIENIYLFCKEKLKLNEIESLKLTNKIISIFVKKDDMKRAKKYIT